MEFGINIYTLLYIKQITTRTYCLAEGTNYTQYFVITQREKNLKI